MKLNTFVRVCEFHKVFGRPVAAEVSAPNADVRLLRYRLLFEEVLEFGRAVGIEGLCEHSDEDFDKEVKLALADFKIDPEAPVDLPGAADALGDIDYVCQGANIVFGFPAEHVAREIHRANMSKLGFDGLPMYDAAGKIMKSPHYRPPDVKQVLIDWSSGETAQREDDQIFGRRA